MEITQYFAAVKRRWPYMLACIVIICGIVLFNVLTSPPIPVYRAVAKIFVASGENTVTAEDLAQMATSNEVAVSCVLGLKLPMEPTHLLQRIGADTGGVGTNRSNIVSITALAVTREEAVAIANKLADLAKERALGLTQLGTFQQGEYIGTRLAAAEARLKVAQEKLRAFKEQHRNLIVPLDFAQARSLISNLEQEARIADSAIQEYEGRVQTLRRTLGTRSSLAKSGGGVVSSAVLERLQADRVAKEMELLELRIRYKDAHPRIKAAQQVLDNIDKRYEAELNKSWNTAGMPISVEYQMLTGDISRYEAEKRAAMSRKSAIQSLLSRAETQLSNIPNLEVEYARLNTDYRTAQENYLTLREKYDQAQLAISIAKKQLEDKQGIGMIDYARGAEETPGYKFQKPVVKMSIALLVALVVGLGIVLMLEAMDTSIRDVDQVEDRYQLPVLGVVPALKEAGLKQGSLVLRDAPDSPYAEPYRIMKTNFQALASQSGAKSVVITSTLPGEGKSTTAANFAASLAESHNKVVLIDGDMRNPTIHRIYGTSKEPGLSNYLEGECSAEEVVYPSPVENLMLIAAGSIPNNPSRLISGKRMRELLELLSSKADYVVIDTPPAVAFSDAMEIAAIADSIILVVGAGSRLESAHFRARSQLANAQATLVGTVLNRVQPTSVDSYRYSSRYYPRGNGHRGLPGGSGVENENSKPAALPESGNS